MHAQIFVKKIRRKMTRTMEAMRCTCRKNDRVGKIRKNMWTLSKAIRKKGEDDKSLETCMAARRAKNNITQHRVQRGFAIRSLHRGRQRRETRRGVTNMTLRIPCLEEFPGKLPAGVRIANRWGTGKAIPKALRSSRDRHRSLRS